jgi:hypothetical protein
MFARLAASLLCLPGAAPEQLALVGATVHSQEPGAEPRVATVLIDGERIVAIAPDLPLEPGTERLDLSGKHLVPGLIDALVNFDPDHDALYVARGVTTVRDPGGDVPVVTQLRERAIRDAVPGPWLLTAGAVFDGDPPSSPAAVVIQDPEQIAPLVRALAEDYRVDLLCAQPGLGEEGLAALCAAGQQHGLEVWGQAVEGVSLARALELGQRGFFGLDPLLPAGVGWEVVLPSAFRANIAAVAGAGTAFVPVLAATERAGRVPQIPTPALRYLAPAYEVLWAADWAAREPLLADPRFEASSTRVDQTIDGLARGLTAAGVVLIPGSTAPLRWCFPGDALIDELEAWVGAGFTPAETLAAATRTAAEVCGIAAERGTVTVGKIADLVVLDGDPREGFAPFRDPFAVVVRGIALERSELHDLVETIGRRQDVLRRENAQPIAIEPPPLPADGALVLGGQVETRSLGTRLSSEVWRAVRLPDGELQFLGRLVIPPQARFEGSQMEVVQTVRDGELTSFALQIETAGESMRVEGRLDAGRFLVRRTHNGSILDTVTVAEKVAAINLTAMADTATTAQVLAQRSADGPATVITFGELFRPTQVRWDLVSRPGRERWIRTHQGGMVLRYGPEGQIQEWGRQAGQSLTTTLGLSSDAYGGPGLPVRFAAADDDAERPAEAPAEPPAEPPPPEEEG